jgi:DNA-binding Xre family transcriptional regulator
MLVFNLKAVMLARQIERPYSFLVKAGISPHSANDLLHSQTRTFRLDHIEKLCEILHCEPNDLLRYKPDNNNKLAETHPLNKLTAKTTDFDWNHTFKTIPLDKLKEVADFINKPKKDDIA